MIHRGAFKMAAILHQNPPGTRGSHREGEIAGPDNKGAIPWPLQCPGKGAFPRPWAANDQDPFHPKAASWPAGRRMRPSPTPYLRLAVQAILQPLKQMVPGRKPFQDRTGRFFRGLVRGIDYVPFIRP